MTHFFEKPKKSVFDPFWPKYSNNIFFPKIKLRQLLQNSFGHLIVEGGIVNFYNDNS